MKRITIARMGLGLAGALSLGVLACDVEQPEVGVQEETEFRGISGDTVFNVQAAPYNAVGDCVADDRSAIQSAINAAELVGGSVFFPEPSGGCYLMDDTTALVLDSKVSLWSESKAEIHQADNVAAIQIRASDVSVRNLRITGPGSGSEVAGSHGIDAAGVAGPIDRIRLDDLEIKDFKDTGIFLSSVSNFDVRSSSIADVYVAGIELDSSSDGRIAKNLIDGVVKTSDPGGGIVLDRGSGTESADPRSSDLVIDSNIIKDVGSNGIYARGAQRVAITGNQISDSHTGIYLRDSSATGGDLASREISVNANVITNPSGGSVNEGIHVTGTSTVDATGISITNNVIEGHGVDVSTVLSGAVRLVYTQGALISGNSIRDPLATGINVYTQNHDFLITGNSILDPTGSFAATPAIWVRSQTNEGQIGDNVLRSSYAGIRIQNFADNTIELGTNRVSGSPSSGEVFIQGGAVSSKYDAHDFVVGQGVYDTSLLLDGSTGSASIYAGDDPANVTSPTKGDLYLCTDAGCTSSLFSYDGGWNGI